jgi:hypothetical protein
MYDRKEFVARLINDKTTYWCAKCETLLFEIGTVPSWGVYGEEEVSSTTDAITSLGRRHIQTKK